jgi:8-oxo-dGTP pyrophosphatase MutT (NUDIX family)
MEQLDKELHRIAITCIIYNNDGKFLVTKRSDQKKAFPGKWTVPGGGLNTDDYTSRPQTNGNAGWYGAVEAALTRELAEEVNVTIGEAKYLLDMTLIRPDGVPVLVLSYYAPFLSGEIKYDADTVDHKWVSVEEAKALDLIPGIYEEIVDVDKILKQTSR